MSRRGRQIRILAAVAVFLVAAIFLIRIRADRNERAAFELMLPDGTPATLWTPWQRPPWEPLPVRPHGVAAPPLVILGHGFLASSEMMGPLARTLVRQGIAVLTWDAAGHGRNAAPLGTWTDLRQSTGVLDFAREELDGVVDTSRIAVGGHSMGAGIAIELAAHRPGIDAVLAIAEGPLPQGPVAVPNLLFVHAEYELPGLDDRIRATFAEMTGVTPARYDRTFGDLADGTARRLVAAGGSEHIGVVWNATTMNEVLAWLGALWSLDLHPVAADPLLTDFLVVFVATLVLSCLLASIFRDELPRAGPLPFLRWPRCLGYLAAACIAAVLALSAGAPLDFPVVEGGDYLLSFFAVSAGLVVLLTAADYRPSWSRMPREMLRFLVVGIGLAAISIVLIGNAGTATSIRLTLAPHRFPLLLASLPIFIGFAVAQDLVTKNGPFARAVWLSLAGLGLMVVVLMSAVAAGIGSDVVMLVLLPTLVLQGSFEVPSLAIYRYSRNPFLSGIYRGTVLAVFTSSAWVLG